MISEEGSTKLCKNLFFYRKITQWGQELDIKSIKKLTLFASWWGWFVLSSFILAFTALASFLLAFLNKIKCEVFCPTTLFRTLSYNWYIKTLSHTKQNWSCKHLLKSIHEFNINWTLFILFFLKDLASKSVI